MFSYFHCCRQARILARAYKELPDKELRKWEKKAEQDKSRYQEEMKDYVPVDDPNGGGGKKKSKKVRCFGSESFARLSILIRVVV